MRPLVDIVTVFHNERNKGQALGTLDMLLDVEDSSRWRWIPVDNRADNRGFAGGCNFGADSGSAPVIGFLNPDVVIRGPFLNPVMTALGADEVVITGARFGKADWELKYWGVRDWVCGAAFFVKRSFFEAMGGFDGRFVWGWEETDLIRQAQACNLRARSIRLPIDHHSPDIDTPGDASYKQKHFERGAALFKEKWRA